MKIKFLLEENGIPLMRRVVALGLVGFTLSAVGSTSQYTVKEGDTLSEILSRFNLSPLYGKNGFVKKAIRLNKNKIRKNGSFIRIGTIINLPLEEPRTSSMSTVEAVENDTVAVQSTEALPKAPQPQMSEEIYPNSYYTLAPHFSFLRVDSTDPNDFGGSQVTLLSKRGLGVNGSWTINYDESFSYRGFFGFDYFSLYTDPNYTFDKSNMSRLSFGVGANWNYSSVLTLSGNLALRDVCFLDVLTPTAVSVASITMPELSLGLKRILATKSNFEASGEGRLGLLLPSTTGTYRSEMGFGAGVSFEMRHKNKSLGVSYDLKTMKVNNISNKESTIAVLMSFLLGNDH